MAPRLVFYLLKSAEQFKWKNSKWKGISQGAMMAKLPSSAVRMRDDITAYIMRQSEQGEGAHQLADRI